MTKEEDIKNGEMYFSIGSDQKPKKVKELIIICSVIVVAIVIIVTLSIVLTRKKESKTINVSVNVINFPEECLDIETPHYLPDGNIIFFYKKKGIDDRFIGIIDDEGKNFKTIFRGNLTNVYRSNGIRLMPFKNNKKVFIGDYILDCSKSFSEATQDECTLRLVDYPKEVQELGKLCLWSEIIIAPDNEHIVWTTLYSTNYAYNFIAKLYDDGKKQNYTLTNVKVISTLNFVEQSIDEKGNITLIPQDIIGGEVKQFLNGGNKITVAGTLTHGLGFSMLQNLESKEFTALNPFEPGYEETTILSPDEKLGIAMSTRFSPNTSFAILDLIPRPYSAYILSKFTMFVYQFCVSSVRNGNPGNIGPVLYDIKKASEDPSYHGIPLYENPKDGNESKWVYYSPMSWHPSGLKAIWPTCVRGDSETRRLNKVVISNYSPSSIPEIKNTTENIPYAFPLEELNNKTILKEIDGYIKGKNKGQIHYYKNDTNNSASLEYLEFSDDGKNVYNGFEGFYGEGIKGIYYANVTVKGDKNGQMDLHLEMSMNGEMDNDKSYGNATYGDITLDVDYLKLKK